MCKLHDNNITRDTVRCKIMAFCSAQQLPSCGMPTPSNGSLPDKHKHMTGLLRASNTGRTPRWRSNQGFMRKKLHCCGICCGHVHTASVDAAAAAGHLATEPATSCKSTLMECTHTPPQAHQVGVSPVTCTTALPSTVLKHHFLMAKTVQPLRPLVSPTADLRYPHLPLNVKPTQPLVLAHCCFTWSAP